jgi:hypothetical protein
MFEVLADDALTDEFLDRYRHAYLALEEDRLAEALTLFKALHEEAPSDGPVAYHLDRLMRAEGSTLIVMKEK